MHLFAGPIDVESYTPAVADSVATGSRVSVSELAERLAALEQEVAELKSRLGD